MAGFSLRAFIVTRLRFGFISGLVIGHDQVDMTDTEGAGEMKKRDNRGVAQAPFEIADILLCHAGDLGETLLSEALLPPQPRKIPADQLAHVHARKLVDTHFEVYLL